MPPTRAGLTPLMLAATGGHAEVATLLLAWGADVNLKARIRRHRRSIPPSAEATLTWRSCSGRWARRSSRGGKLPRVTSPR